MKVIDLLNKIANDEEIPMIKYKERRYKYNKEDYWFDDLDDEARCMNELYFYDLDDEVEIIEEDKKIEKLYGAPRRIYTENEKYIAGKVNEIIDRLNAGVDKE